MVTATVLGQQVKIAPTKLLINHEWVESVSDRQQSPGWYYVGKLLRRI
ncbi:MAG: hypothetical protein HWQ41_22115 [Nostoc sp. NOS(2021)]|nr:hypothetical protein [Nostoc sp. NOS(2021)]MBN3897861.1 hypothetical protein [Nostoc sp. NOS(2021)]